MRVSIAAIGAALAVLVMTGAANAQDQATPPQANVDVRGLDLTHPAGQAVAEKRLQNSASAACERSGASDLQGKADAAKCKNDLVAKGRAGISSVGAQQASEQQEARRQSYAAGYRAGRDDSVVQSSPSRITPRPHHGPVRHAARHPGASKQSG